MVGGVPWRTSDDDDEMDGPSVRMTLGERLTEEEARVQTELSAEAVPRRMFIQKSDLEQHGYTAGCLGCRPLLSGRVRQMHSADCRRRFELIL